MKPKNIKINIETLKPAQLEYYCSTVDIDREVLVGMGLTFNNQAAMDMQISSPFYFVVKKNGEYDVIKGIHFEPWLEGVKAHHIDIFNITDKAKACKDHFMPALIEEHKKNAHLLEIKGNNSFNDLK